MIDDPEEDESLCKGFRIEDEISDPLIRVSDVERILLESGVVPKHQVPLILEKLRDDAHGPAFDMGDDMIDFDSDDYHNDTDPF